MKGSWITRMVRGQELRKRLEVLDQGLDDYMRSSQVRTRNAALTAFR